MLRFRDFGLSLAFICTICVANCGVADQKPLTQRALQEGIEFVAIPEVSQEAVVRAQYVVRTMLSKTAKVRDKMRSNKFKIEVIGKSQVLSDLQDFAQLKIAKTFDGRSYDKATRGVGEVSRCSVGEENLMCAEKQLYWQEDILVHEFTHSMHANFEEKLKARIA